MEDASVSSLKDYRKNVSLIFDERQTKPNLVYRRFAGKLIGSTAVGDISEEFWKFSENFCLEDDEDSSTTTNYHRDIATHVIVCTVRGLFSKIVLPICIFCTHWACVSPTLSMYHWGISSSRVYWFFSPCLSVRWGHRPIKSFINDGSERWRQFLHF